MLRTDIEYVRNYRCIYLRKLQQIKQAYRNIERGGSGVFKKIHIAKNFSLLDITVSLTIKKRHFYNVITSSVSCIVTTIICR